MIKINDGGSPIGKIRKNINDEVDIVKEKPSLLLHSCCAPCSTAVIESLVKEFQITVFFYNPNITDSEEYNLRRKELIKFLDRYNKRRNAREKVHYLEGEYDPETFLFLSKGLEKEPEGGKRCIECFKFRLERTAEESLLRGYFNFTTTLGISPYKNFEQIKSIGNMLGMRYNINFLARDFSPLYKRSIELSKKYDLYRQKFCGCDFAR